MSIDVVDIILAAEAQAAAAQAPAPVAPPPGPAPPQAPPPQQQPPPPSFRSYLTLNRYAVLPLAAAIIVFVLAQFATQLPTDCPTAPPDYRSVFQTNSAPQDRLRGNAVFCGPAETVQRVFAEARARLQAIDALMRPADPASESARQADLAQARGDLFKEAKARLLWIGGFSVEIAVGCAAILGMAWVLIVSLGEHWRDEQLAPRPGQGGFALRLLGLSVIAGVVFYLVLWRFAASVLFHGLTAPDFWSPSFFTNPIRYAGDRLRDFIFSDLFPGGGAVAATASVIVFLAVCMIALAVTTTLYDRPDQAGRRRQPAR
ncbi:MAG: hypothetical protein ACLQJR_26875, partial [Stellaceae bacterium]